MRLSVCARFSVGECRMQKNDLGLTEMIYIVDAMRFTWRQAEELSATVGNYISAPLIFSLFPFNNSSTTISGKNELNPTLSHAHLVPIAIFFSSYHFLWSVIPPNSFFPCSRSSFVTLRSRNRRHFMWHRLGPLEFGRDLRLLRLANFSENWEISSLGSATFGE